MEPPLVSIVVPSFNQGRYIRATIDSILSQDYRPIEILVLDGASKDETVDVLRSYRAPELQWWSRPDRGVVDAVNQGLDKAAGAIIAIQSSDDTYLPNAITTAVTALMADPTLGLVYGDVEYIDGQSHLTGGTNLPPFDFAGYVSKLTFIPQPAAFFTREAAKRAGGWREEISYAADAEFYLRIASSAGVRKLDARLAQYRYHEEQRDRAGSKIARDWAAAIHSWIETERPSGSLLRGARAGIHLTNAHYLPESRWATRTMELYRAALLYPPVLRHREFPLRELIPGRTPVWRILSRIKQTLGFPPRQG